MEEVPHQYSLGYSTVLDGRKITYHYTRACGSVSLNFKCLRPPYVLSNKFNKYRYITNSYFLRLLLAIDTRAYEINTVRYKWHGKIFPYNILFSMLTRSIIMGTSYFTLDIATHKHKPRHAPIIAILMSVQHKEYKYVAHKFPFQIFFPAFEHLT